MIIIKLRITVTIIILLIVNNTDTNDNNNNNNNDNNNDDSTFLCTYNIESFLSPTMITPRPGMTLYFRNSSETFALMCC